MGQVSLRKIIVMVVCFGIVGLMVHLRPTEDTLPQKRPLAQVLSQLNGWQKVHETTLSEHVVEALKLDDYLFQSFSAPSGEVTLYIGYYRNAKKVGAAHDPMVCYPGQGWKVTELAGGKHDLQADSAAMVEYSSMITELDGEKELVLYWFQAHDKASPGTFGQKATLLKQRFLNNPLDNAFIRITTSLDDCSEEDAKAMVLKFVDSFYPVYLDYVRNS